MQYKQSRDNHADNIIWKNIVTFLEGIQSNLLLQHRLWFV